MTSPELLVYDQNADALARRMVVVAEVAVDGLTPVGVSSPTALLVRAQVAAEGSVALIDLCDSDRDIVARPGVPLIERVARLGLHAHAWTAHVSPDAVDEALAAGAASVISSHGAQESAQLRAAMTADAPIATVPRSQTTEHWETWFRGRFGRDWRPWMEPVLVRLAATGERGAHAHELVAAGVVATTRAATAKQRDLAQLLASDRHRTPRTVAATASLVLAGLASTRSLPERPQSRASVLQAFEAVRAQPSLTLAAALSVHELGVLQTLAGSVLERRARDGRTAGAPLAGEIDAALIHAAGHAARDLGVTAPDDLERTAAGLICTAESAALAIGTALDDELFAPHARAAAALLAWQRRGSRGALPGVSWVGNTACWRGLDVRQLSAARDAAPGEAMAFTAAVDEALTS